MFSISPLVVIVHLAYVHSVSQTRTTVLDLPAYDAVGIVSTDMFVTMIETTVAIIAVCLPATRKVVSWVTFSHFFGISSLGRYYANLRSSSNRSRSNIREIDSKTSASLSDRSAQVSQTESSTGLRQDYMGEKAIPLGRVHQTTTYTVQSFTCDQCGNQQTSHTHEGVNRSMV